MVKKACDTDRHRYIKTEVCDVPQRFGNLSGLQVPEGKVSRNFVPTSTGGIGSGTILAAILKW
jgi:hypothetical protein